MNDQTEVRKRYTQKRLDKAKDYLGSKCKECNTTENLEFDHIDPQNKEIEITTAVMAKCWSWDKLVIELNKCQLLCKECHLKKTIKSYPIQPCGTYWKYRKYKCRCKECVLANTEQLRKWKYKPL